LRPLSRRLGNRPEIGARRSCPALTTPAYDFTGLTNSTTGRFFWNSPAPSRLTK
jgi:hypothetical protein